ncbi:MAG: hypothetical protein ABII88_03335 [Candidatus Omnitrophota bacterium]
MGKYSKRSSSKALVISVALTIIILTLFLSTVIADWIFSAHKGRIEKDIGRYLNQELSIGSIQYFPPCFIILKNVSMFSDESLAEYPPLTIERITLVFSLHKFLKNKKMVITKLYFIKPKVDFFEYPLFFKENIEGIIEVINVLAQGNPIRIVMEDALLILNRRGRNVNALFTTMRLRIEPNKRLTTYGTIDLFSFFGDQIQKKVGINVSAKPLQYYLKGSIARDGMTIDNLEFNKGNFCATLEGKLKQSVLKLNGFSTIEDFYKTSLDFKNQESDLSKKIRHLLMYGKLPQKIGISSRGLNILDINCVVRFASKNIALEDLSFYLDNIPVKLDGSINFEDKTLFDLNFSAVPARKRITCGKGVVQQIQAQVKTEIQRGWFDGSAQFTVLKTIKDRQSSQTVRADVQGGSFGFSPDRRVKVLFENFFAAYSLDNDEYSLRLKNFDAFFNFLNPRVKFVKFVSAIYEGSLAGYAAIDLGFKPVFKANYNISIKDVNARALDSLLMSLFKTYRKFPGTLHESVGGTFDCNINYVSQPRSTMQGNMQIKNGRLDNVRFLVWLADFFSIPSLKTIDFKTLSSKFTVYDNAFSVDEIALDAGDIQLAGFFRMQEDELVSSKLFLTLPRILLSNSPKFQLLLALIGGEVPFFTFDFQLSGAYRALNFKWLESSFKQEIQKILPNFIERGIETKLEAAIKSIAE